MADQINDVGSFIPNKAGNPKILTLSPAERAEYLAAKSAKEQRVRAQNDATVQPVESEATPVVVDTATVEPVVGGTGVDINV